MKQNPILRAVAFALCALTAAAGFWAAVATLSGWSDLWSNAGYFNSSNYYHNLYVMEDRVQELARMELRKKNVGLTYTEQEHLDALKRSLSPESTNYRYELRVEQTGELISSNLNGALMDSTASGIQIGLFTVYDGEYTHYEDDTTWTQFPEEEAECELLRVWTGSEYLEFRADQATPDRYNQYGWYSNGAEWLDYSQDQDSRITSVEYALRAGALKDLSGIEDDFWSGSQNYARWSNELPTIAVGALVSLGTFLVLLVLLCLAAGHKAGVDGIWLGWPHRVPLEVYVLAAIAGVTLAGVLGDGIVSVRGLDDMFQSDWVAALVAVTALGTASCLALILTAAARLKARKFLETCLLWRVCLWGWKLLCRFARAVKNAVQCVVRTLSMDVRLGLAFLVYLGINAFLAGGFYLTAYSRGYFLVGLVLFNGGAFWLGCRWIEQWRRIRAETGRVLGGDTTAQIDTKKMYPDLKQHAEQLNDLGASINRAVDERMKSEHFKAELITNVSHDLKTPLTSIINYVDLLKKEPIENPKAREYIEVLDRKSQRLKKLTEDLVEASKASTGNVTVNAARLDLVEFTQQAAAEYADRLTAQRLTLITKMADRPVYVSADGRHLWRILDNLLGNCVKYALEGTRVYLDVVEWDGKGCISVKNISRDELNVSPEELTERFVRGDESRTTEGSGLGLSIARSLTEVQGGTFRVTTDGDLFKATVYFPVVLALEETNLGERA